MGTRSTAILALLVSGLLVLGVAVPAQAASAVARDGTVTSTRVVPEYVPSAS